MRIKTEKFLCTIDFILIHRYCIENLNERKTHLREQISGIFYVFAIWIGFGVYALYESAQNIYKKVAGPIIIVVY
jgi:hypothetical protein